MPRYLFHALAFGKKKILPMFPLGNMRAAGPLIARIIPGQEHLLYHKCLQAQYRAVVLFLGVAFVKQLCFYRNLLRLSAFC